MGEKENGIAMPHGQLGPAVPAENGEGGLAPALPAREAVNSACTHTQTLALALAPHLLSLPTSAFKHTSSLTIPHHMHSHPPRRYNTIVHYSTLRTVPNPANQQDAQVP